MPVLCLENHGKQGIRTPHPNSAMFFAIEFDREELWCPGSSVFSGLGNMD